MRRSWGVLGLAASALAGVGAAKVALPRPGISGADAASVQSVPGGELTLLSVHASPRDARVGDIVQLTAEVSRGRARHGALRFSWTASRGVIEGAGAASARWHAPFAVGNFGVTLEISDDDGKVSGGADVSVRLPPGGGAVLAAAARAEAAAPDQERIELQAAVDQEAGPLREKAARRNDVGERREAKGALEKLGALYLSAARYQAAYDVYSELRANVLRNTTDYREYSAALGRAAYQLGKDREALVALEEAGPWRSSQDHYFYADLIERSGDRDQAIAAYARAWDSDVWYGEPLYREALLQQQRGDDPVKIIDLLVQASSRLDRDHMLERLSTDPELASVHRLLLDSGRADELRHHMPFRWRADGTREDITAEARP